MVMQVILILVWHLLLPRWRGIMWCWKWQKDIHSINLKIINDMGQNFIGRWSNCMDLVRFIEKYLLKIKTGQTPSLYRILSLFLFHSCYFISMVCQDILEASFTFAAHFPIARAFWSSAIYTNVFLSVISILSILAGLRRFLISVSSSSLYSI